jgi:hypothetical protein
MTPEVQDRSAVCCTWLTSVPDRVRLQRDRARSRGGAQALLPWTAERGLEHGACDVEHYRIGPVEEPDWTRWETEFAYLVQ